MEVNGYQIQIIDFASPEYDESVRLRHEILRKPLKIEFEPDQLALEYDSIHIAAYDEGETMVGCLILKQVGEDVFKMRQVAVLESNQGKGVGKALVQFSESLAKHKNFRSIELNARDTAVPFYEKLNYKTEREPFVEVGIPHRFMKKILI